MSSKTVQKNILSEKEEWNIRAKMLLEKCSTPIGALRLFHLHYFLDFLVEESSRKYINPMFMVTLTRKLNEFKSTVGNHGEKVYFRNIEEQLDIHKFCKSYTNKGYKCCNKISKNKKTKYCKIHNKKLMNISNNISSHTTICSDISNLISQYV